MKRKRRLTGISKMLKNASSEDAHSKPILSYMYVANMGKPPPTKEEYVSKETEVDMRRVDLPTFRTKITPASADAEYGP